MESSQPAATSQLGKDNYRCVQLGLGSSLQGDDHGRTLVTDLLYYINYLEMLAAFLALQCFTKYTPRPLIVYLYMDNTTAILCLNLKGGTTSPSLCMLAKQT